MRLHSCCGCLIQVLVWTHLQVLVAKSSTEVPLRTTSLIREVLVKAGL